MSKLECAGLDLIIKTAKKDLKIVRAVKMKPFIWLLFMGIYCFYFGFMCLYAAVPDESLADRSSDKLQSAIYYGIDGDQVTIHDLGLAR
jgi:hypothetical protein